MNTLTAESLETLRQRAQVLIIERMRQEEETGRHLALAIMIFKPWLPHDQVVMRVAATLQKWRREVSKIGFGTVVRTHTDKEAWELVWLYADTIGCDPRTAAKALGFEWYGSGGILPRLSLDRIREIQLELK